MYYWIVNCSLGFVFCVFCAGYVIPEILLIAFRKRLFDVPDERKVHRSSVPRLGGIAFKPVVFLAVALLLGVNLALGRTEILFVMEEEARPLAFAFCCIMVLYLVGIADDLIGVRYRAKFIVQILCGVMLVAGGLRIDNLFGVVGLQSIPAWVGWPLTVLVTVFIINAVNLIDGIDGLASGLSGTACMAYGIVFFILHRYIYSLLSFTTLGVLVPFFYYNVFGDVRKHRKIFMGDTGSLTVGMMLCFLSLTLVRCGGRAVIGNMNPIVLAFSPLIVPCVDVVRVFLHRVRTGRNPFMPDKNHIHHKLLALGMGQRAAMCTIVAVSILLTLINMLLSRYINVNWIVAGDIVLWTGANIILSKLIIRRRPGLAEKQLKINEI